MSLLYAEMLMGHRQGLAIQSYVKPTVSQMYEEYMKVVDSVTIAEENRLKRKVSELEEYRAYWSQMRKELDELKRLVAQ